MASRRSLERGQNDEKPTQTRIFISLPRFLRILSPCIMHRGMPLKAKMKVPWRGTPGAHTSRLWPPLVSLYLLFLKTLPLLALPLARGNFRIICFLYTRQPEGEESFIFGVPFILFLTRFIMKHRKFENFPNWRRK